MATIFDGYKKATDEQIAEQIAIIHTITFDNFLSLYGNKIKKVPSYAVNGIRRIFNKKFNIKEEKVKEIHEIVEEKKEKLKKFSRIELDKRLKLLLCERSNLSFRDSDYMISSTIINEAAKLFNINDNLMPAKKADSIYEKVHKINLKKIINNIDSSIKTYALFVILFIIILPISLHIAGNSLGAFMIILLGYLALIGIFIWNIAVQSKNIHMKIMAYSVRFSIECYGKLFTPKNEELPSWALKMKYNEVEKEDEEFIKLLHKKQKISDEAKEVDWKGINLRKYIKEQKDSLENEKNKCFNFEIKKKEFQHEELRLYNEKVLLYEKFKKIEEKIKIKHNRNLSVSGEINHKFEVIKQQLKVKIQQLENVKSKLKKINEAIDNGSKQIEICKSNINNGNEKLKLLELEDKKVKEKEENLKENLSIEQANRIEELNNLWQIYFPKFEFKTDIFYNVVTLSFKNRLEIERALIQLHDLDDPKAIYNREKTKNHTESIKVVLSEGVFANIEYRINTNYDNKIMLLKISMD